MANPRLLVAALFALPLIALVQSFPALAQAWPAKTIRLVVPYPPGGSTDLLGRAVAQKLSESLGQQVVVDNRGGANGTLGSDMVARAAPDGYTFLLGTGATHGITSLMSKAVPYDPVKDFTAITAAAEVPIVLVTHPGVPAANVKELLEYGRKNTGKLAFGSSGTGSPHHLAGELFKQVNGVNLVPVPYKCLGPPPPDPLRGEN